MAKVLKAKSLEHESLKSDTHEMDEIETLILHKIHAGSLSEARVDLNRVAKGIRNVSARKNRRRDSSEKSTLLRHSFTNFS